MVLQVIEEEEARSCSEVQERASHVCFCSFVVDVVSATGDYGSLYIIGTSIILSILYLIYEECL